MTKKKKNKTFYFDSSYFYCVQILQIQIQISNVGKYLLIERVYEKYNTVMASKNLKLIYLFF